MIQSFIFLSFIHGWQTVFLNTQLQEQELCLTRLVHRLIIPTDFNNNFFDLWFILVLVKVTEVAAQFLYLFTEQEYLKQMWFLHPSILAKHAWSLGGTTLSVTMPIHHTQYQLCWIEGWLCDVGCYWGTDGNHKTNFHLWPKIIK